MSSLTVIIYPSARDHQLLSMTDYRSRYMVPFAGRYRIIDFALRNVLTAEPEQIVVYSGVYDDLTPYLETHPLSQMKKCRIVPIVDDSFSVAQLAKVVKKHETSHYMIWCGDTPGFVDFGEMFEYYIKKKKNKTVLYQLKIHEKATMAYTALMTTRKNFLSVLNDVIKTKKSSPHIFEMLNNMLINKGVEKHTHGADLWPIKSVPDYYNTNYAVFRSPELFESVYNDPYLVSGIKTDQPAKIGPNADIRGSIISNGCIIDGTVINSILYPGVIVAEKARVEDSILFPYVAVGKQSVVETAVIDEFTDYVNSPFLYNIGERSRVGTMEKQLRNSDFPRSLFASISLVGKNCLIPENVNIGGGCFVDSATGPSQFSSVKTIDDGLSVVPYPEIYQGE